MDAKRPLIFIDLDDTLFQTARKMPKQQDKQVAAFDKEGQPNSFMNSVQQSLFSWLSSSADVIPVTARSIEAYSRVKLPFTHGAICSFGGSILLANGTLDNTWHHLMQQQLDALQAHLKQLSAVSLAVGRELGVSIRSWVVEEQGLGLYVVVKQGEGNDALLQQVLQAVTAQGLLVGMQAHTNSNNLAFLPNCLSKQNAVKEWLQRDQTLHGERPILGFGDSISDLGFLQQCHFWATPAQSQLANEFLNRGVDD